MWVGCLVGCRSVGDHKHNLCGAATSSAEGTAHPYGPTVATQGSKCGSGILLVLPAYWPTHAPCCCHCRRTTGACSTCGTPLRAHPAWARWWSGQQLLCRPSRTLQARTARWSQGAAQAPTGWRQAAGCSLRCSRVSGKGACGQEARKEASAALQAALCSCDSKALLAKALLASGAVKCRLATLPVFCCDWVDWCNAAE